MLGRPVQANRMLEFRSKMFSVAEAVGHLAVGENSAEFMAVFTHGDPGATLRSTVADRQCLAVGPVLLHSSAAAPPCARS